MHLLFARPYLYLYIYASQYCTSKCRSTFPTPSVRIVVLFKWGISQWVFGGIRNTLLKVISINFVLRKFNWRLNRKKKSKGRKAEDIKPTGTPFVDKKCLDDTSRGAHRHNLSLAREIHLPILLRSP